MKEKKIKTIQIRITDSEKQMLEEIRNINPKFNVSTLFRYTLMEYYKRAIEKHMEKTLQAESSKEIQDNQVN